jgi:hypothetical protein
MKLLSQRYLGGDVTFTSSDEKGTTFRASYPLGALTGDGLVYGLGESDVSHV